MGQTELNPFQALFRILSGVVGGMVIAAFLQTYYSTATGLEFLLLGMLLGSFFGFLSTIRRPEWRKR